MCLAGLSIRLNTRNDLFAVLRFICILSKTSLARKITHNTQRSSLICLVTKRMQRRILFVVRLSPNTIARLNGTRLMTNSQCNSNALTWNRTIWFCIVLALASLFFFCFVLFCSVLSFAPPDFLSPFKFDLLASNIRIPQYYIHSTCNIMMTRGCVTLSPTYLTKTVLQTGRIPANSRQAPLGRVSPNFFDAPRINICHRCVRVPVIEVAIFRYLAHTGTWEWTKSGIPGSFNPLHFCMQLDVAYFQSILLWLTLFSYFNINNIVQYIFHISILTILYPIMWLSDDDQYDYSYGC